MIFEPETLSTFGHTLDTPHAILIQNRSYLGPKSRLNVAHLSKRPKTSHHHPKKRSTHSYNQLGLAFFIIILLQLVFVFPAFLFADYLFCALQTISACQVQVEKQIVQKYLQTTHGTLFLHMKSNFFPYFRRQLK